MHRRSLLLVARPLFDKEWKDIPSIICYARDYMYPKEEYLIDLDKNVLDTLVPITDVVKGYNATFIKYPVYIKQTIELIKKLQPELTKLAFIFDRRYISQQTKADVEAVLRKDFPGIQFEPLSTTSISTETYWTDWPLSTIRPESFITHGTGPGRITRIVT